jgi:large subunit ribosomal protein L16
MLLQPRKTKYRKEMKRLRHIRGVECRGCELVFGDYGLRAVESGWITGRQIEAGRVAVARKAKRGGKLWIGIAPRKPITKKPAETRMGSGKGSPEYWVAEVRAGKVLFEITGVTRAVALEALEQAAAKMPLACRVVERSDYLL